MLDIVDELLAFKRPMCKGGHVILAPGRAEVIGKRLASIVVFQSKSMVEIVEFRGFIDAVGE